MMSVSSFPGKVITEVQYKVSQVASRSWSTSLGFVGENQLKVRWWAYVGIVSRCTRRHGSHSVYGCVAWSVPQLFVWAYHELNPYNTFFSFNELFYTYIAVYYGLVGWRNGTTDLIPIKQWSQESIFCSFNKGHSDRWMSSWEQFCKVKKKKLGMHFWMQLIWEIMWWKLMYKPSRLKNSWPNSGNVHLLPLFGIWPEDFFLFWIWSC